MVRAAFAGRRDPDAALSSERRRSIILARLKTPPIAAAETADRAGRTGHGRLAAAFTECGCQRGEEPGPASLRPDRSRGRGCDSRGGDGARLLALARGIGCTGHSGRSSERRPEARGGVGRFRRERAARGSGPKAASAVPPDPLAGEGRSGSEREPHSLRLPDDHRGEHGAGPDPGQPQGRVPRGRVRREKRRPALVAEHRLSDACIRQWPLRLDPSAARRADAPRGPGSRRCRGDGHRSPACQQYDGCGAAAGVLRRCSVAGPPAGLRQGRAHHHTADRGI